MKKSELRQIIKEEIESLFKDTGRLTPYLSKEDFEKKWSTDEFKKPIEEYGNPAPPKDSNWYEFAHEFDIGILDLDKFASLMKLRDYRMLDVSINPKSLFKRDKNKFIKAIKQSSLSAEDMSSSEIQKIVMSLWP